MAGSPSRRRSVQHKDQQDIWQLASMGGRGRGMYVKEKGQEVAGLNHLGKKKQKTAAAAKKNHFNVLLKINNLVINICSIQQS